MKDNTAQFDSIRLPRTALASAMLIALYPSICPAVIELPVEKASATMLEDTTVRDIAAASSGFQGGDWAKLAIKTLPALTEVVFIDSQVQDGDELLRNLRPGVRVVKLSPQGDGIEEIARELQGAKNLRGIHIISHGSDGQLQLGAQALDKRQLTIHRKALGNIGKALQAGGDILLYGCDVAASSKGVNFIRYLAKVTGADVTASNDRTGATAKGSDWELEIATGDIESRAPLAMAAMEKYGYDLATITVTNNNDSGAGSLRQAIADATAGDTINFDATYTISLTTKGEDNGGINDDSLLYINKNLTIDGGANTIVLDGGHNGRVLKIESGATVSLDTITIQNGLLSGNGGSANSSAAAQIGGDALGAGIYNAGTLTITGSTVTANKGAGGGGSADNYAAGGGGGFSSKGGGTGGFDFSGAAGGAGGSGTGGNGGGLNAGAGGSTTGGAGGDDSFLAQGGAGGSANAGGNQIGGGGGGSGNGLGVGGDAIAGGRGGHAAGAIYNTGTLTITSTSVSNNAGAGGGGGGASGQNGGNGGRGVGAIWNEGGTLNVDSTTNSNISSGNNAGGSGGGGTGKSASNGTSLIADNTIWNDGNSDGIEDATNLDTNYSANTPPTSPNTTQTVNFTEDTTTAIADMVITDPDADTWTATFTMAAGDDSLGSLSASSGKGETFTAGTGVWTISSSTKSAVNNALAAMSFVPASNVPTSTTASTSISDGVAAAVTGTITFSGTAVNDDPAIASLPTDVTVNEDILSNVDLSAATLSDVDSAASSITLTVAAAAGTLTSTTGGGVTVGGSGSGTLTLSGTASNIDTFLNTTTNIKYTGASNAAGNDATTLTLTANDGGNTGTGGGGNVALGTVNVDITAVNDDPAIASLPTDITVTEDTLSNVDLSAATLSDVDSAASSITLTIAAAAGTLTATSGGGVTVGGSGTGTLTLSGTASNIDTFLNTTTNIQYTGTSNAAGNDAATLTLMANDGGNTGIGGGGNVALGTVNVDIAAVGDTPSVTNATTNEDTQTTSGLVITKSVNDGAEVTHYKITSITGGTLYQNNGSTAIANNAFITVAEGAAGLKFTPTANSSSNGSFDVQAGTDGVGGGLSAGSDTATITVTAIADTPSITNAITNEDVQTTSGLVVSRNANDSTEVTHFRVSGITGGTLYQNDGTTAIANNEYITFAQANAGLKFTPTANSSSNGSFSVQGATSAGGAGLSAGSATATITVSPVGDTPSITGASTNKNMQSTSGLVISRNANDGAEVTHYKITSINGGTLYKNDGTTVIANNAFITVAEGAAGLKFTPATNSTANGTFNVQAGTDGVGGGLSAGSATATITVAGVNNPPTGNAVITGGSNPPLVGETLTADTSGISDADGLGTFSYQWKRGGSSISGATSNTYPLVIADAGNAITVTVGYTDGDSTLESITSAATAVVDSDFDGDGIGDATDPDDDNDGMTDVWELAYGLDPKDASDATGDIDGDGVSNLDEFIASSDPTADDYAPVVTPPVDITIGAAGLFTAVDVGIATATDDLDGVLTPTSDAPSNFTPGVNTVTWSATDAAGNTGTATQIININPLVDFSKDQVTSEGSTVNFSVILNGDAVTYPVSIPYTVSGTAATDLSDHNLVDGTATINSGTEVVVSFTAVDDGAGEGLENIVVTMGVPTNAATGPNAIHTIDLIEGNVAPTVSLSANQGAGGTLTVTQVDGLVTVASSVLDPNNGDTHTYDWSMTDNALIDTDGVDSSFSFDPSGVSAGVYTLRLSVSDGNAADEAEISINVVSAAPVLTTADSDGDGTDDQTEGYGDSDGDGVAEYLDAISSINVLQEQAGESARYLIETEPGLTLSLSRIAFQAGNGQAQVSPTDIANAGSTNDDTTQYEFAGGLFDFTVSDLPVAGQSASIVLAQLAAIPANAVYRKLAPGGWQDFVVDADNAIASAPGAQGYCPPPGDAAYQTGLTEGHWCVQLTIKDGGPNDGDGDINNSVDDPGGVATILATDVNVKVSSSGGGIGSQDPLWLVLLALLGLPRFLVARKGGKH